ncbi:vesicular inhibitory amino acid transporter-like [Tachypleus tridentatus]|uniref:vesicular inhibitory amino acid transporter-like n=1 Tax=Tachypleus tridentatus TaxID=6853 RepID=UPI003FD361B5
MSWYLYRFVDTLKSVKSYLPDSCWNDEEQETVHFAKHGHGRDDTELHSFREEDGDRRSSDSFDENNGERQGGNSKLNGSVPGTNVGGEGEFGGRESQISEWQAGWNVTNAIQGMFIVSLPYACLHGGYWGIFALVFVAYICCHTGKILVACLYEPNESGETVRVRDSYVAIAQSCLGDKWGGKIVNTAQIIELLMTCILYVVLCGDLMIGSFPDGPVDQRSWMMIATMFLLPCAFLQNLRSVSWLSFWCTVAHILINIIVMGYCFTRASYWAFSKVPLRIEIHYFPISLGIVVFSYTSQIFLPTLEGNMRDPSRFHCMLNWSHLAAAIFKGLFAYVGFLTWAEQTQEVITNNLPTKAFKVIVNLTLVIKAMFSYPLPYYAAANLIEIAFFQGKPTTKFPSCFATDKELRVWAVALRVLLVIFTMLMAISIPHFAILMGLIGSFTGTMLSFVWPCYFHMKLKWNELPWYTISWEVFIISIGSFCGVIGIYYSFSALVQAYHLPLPHGETP